MIAAFDTYYYDTNKAKTVCLLLEQWTDTTPVGIYSEILEGVAEYTPGEFYLRELPCIMSLLAQMPVVHLTAIVVDGFVYLDDEGKPGLGAHLSKALQGAVPVIGVAKTNFATLVNNKRALLRGDSIKPLFITAVGIDIEVATAHIKSMAGPYRIPTLLKQLDTLTKALEQA